MELSVHCKLANRVYKMPKSRVYTCLLNALQEAELSQVQAHGVGGASSSSCSIPRSPVDLEHQLTDALAHAETARKEWADRVILLSYFAILSSTPLNS